jgi:hypothetical protein
MAPWSLWHRRRAYPEEPGESPFSGVSSAALSSGRQGPGAHLRESARAAKDRGWRFSCRFREIGFSLAVLNLLRRG